MYQRLFFVLGLAWVEIIWLLGVAAPATDTPSYEVYTVQDNQTIASIAADYQVPAEVIAQYNKLKVTDPLKAGQTLLVPLHVQLTPQTTTYAAPEVKTVTPPAKQSVPAPTAKQVVGYLATVTAKNAEIRSKPNGSDVLYDKLAKGKELLVIGQITTHYAVLMSDGSTGWIPRVALAVSETQMVVDRPVEPTLNTRGRMDLIETAYEYLGIPYKYGGKLPNSIDCSLLVQTVFKRHGISLPRTAAMQFNVGTPVEPADLLPGDRLYFYNPARTMIGHTGLYVGNGRFIHASSNRGCVYVDELTNPTYAKKYAGARR